VRVSCHSDRETLVEQLRRMTAIMMIVMIKLKPAWRVLFGEMLVCDKQLSVLAAIASDGMVLIRCFRQALPMGNGHPIDLRAKQLPCAFTN
jgi:hypothetical protein